MSVAPGQAARTGRIPRRLEPLSTRASAHTASTSGRRGDLRTGRSCFAERFPFSKLLGEALDHGRRPFVERPCSGWDGRPSLAIKRSVQFFYVETHPLLTNVIFLH